MLNSKLNDNPADCGRKDDLVAYLYQEASPAECESFESHLDSCGVCRDELQSFGRVRQELSTWQLGWLPQTSFELPQSPLQTVRGFFALFPLWARGVALTTAAAALLIVALSVAGTKILVNGPSTGAGTDSAQLESMVRDAVARDRAQMQQDFSAQLASLKQQLNEENEARMQAAQTQYNARIEAVQAGFRAQIRKSNKENQSIRSFFAMDDSPDPLGVGGVGGVGR
ncbi:MAG: zf-HC2 domain-containing protein [Acidobacteria bacterium]|nr:zf-HC2 domain-containing protein [Acidobacteriota bacterium]MBK9707647.1 zf-HC2 domain-containing protein [Acidobacteriota bacterium]